MNWIDAILFLILLLSVISSVQRGFIISMLDLICWAGSLILALFLYDSLSKLFDALFSTLGAWSAPLAFIILLVGSRVILDSLAQKILHGIREQTHTTTINRLFGIIPGVVNGFLWVTVISSLLLLLPINTHASEDGRDSKLTDWTVSNVQWLEDRLAPVFNELFNEVIPKPSAAVGKQTSIDLPFKVAHPKVRNDLEAEMLVMLNQERKKHGLKPLRADPAIAVAARKHSADMLARGYFSHVTPEGIDPFQRIRKEKIVFITAGENLALAQTLAIAHTGLMNSPGHRANILRPAFGRVGIGVLDGGVYGLMITQNFRN
jgi:uncharacterized protein YkwD